MEPPESAEVPADRASTSVRQSGAPTRPGDTEGDRSDSAAPLLERYRRMFNKKDAHFWSIVFGYPIGRMLVLFLPEHRWVTPTALTLIGFAIKVAAAVCLLFPGVETLIAAIVALQISTILDSMDGTLARARNMASLVGAFLDKVLDATGLFLLCAVVGIRAHADSGEPWGVVAACSGGAAYAVVCYMYWVVKATEERRVTATSLAAEVPVLTWRQIGRQWLMGWTDIVKFNEADLYLWVSVFAALDEWTYLAYLLGATQGVTLIKRGVDHVVTLSHRQPAAKSG